MSPSPMAQATGPVRTYRSSRPPPSFLAPFPPGGLAWAGLAHASGMSVQLFSYGIWFVACFYLHALPATPASWEREGRRAARISRPWPASRCFPTLSLHPPPSETIPSAPMGDFERSFGLLARIRAGARGSVQSSHMT